MIKQKNASVAIIAIIIVSAVAVIGVGIFLYPYSPENPPVADDFNATPEGIQKVVGANNNFAFDLYSELNKNEGGNIFYSPYSISAALAMTYEGAKGQTANEIKSVFYFPENNILRPNFASIYNGINAENNDYELKTGNALWLQQDYPFIKEYVTTVENYYGGKAAGVDFVNEVEMTRQTINSFIEEQTNNKINDLIPQGMLNPLTRMVLTNAIYFKGTWEWEFDKSDTKDRDFKIAEDNVVSVPMMYLDNDKAKFNYANLDNLQILELPYKGNDLSMLVLLPKQGKDYNYETEEIINYNYNLEDIEFSSEKLEEYKSQMQEVEMERIYLPKFEFDTKYMLKEILGDLGMPIAFAQDGSADFSGMTEAEQLFISNIIHQAYVKVDEKGTEAAAATAVIMAATGMPDESKIFRADHPFIFIIQERETGNILFLGRVIDPR